MKPSTPINPEAIGTTHNSVDLTWQPPRHDGGSKILGYIVEYQKVGDEEWKRANHTPESCPETNYKVTGLQDGQSYKFRVIAVNVASESDPAHVPEPVLVKDRFGECNVLSCLCKEDRFHCLCLSVKYINKTNL